MSAWKCNSCGGTYSDTCPDGWAYYHACPPAGIDAAGAAISRPNPRDENLRLSLTASPGAIKAEGLGRTAMLEGQPAPSPPPEQPGFLLSLWYAITGR
jgi:hypothetical protein